MKPLQQLLLVRHQVLKGIQNVYIIRVKYGPSVQEGFGKQDLANKEVCIGMA